MKTTQVYLQNTSLKRMFAISCFFAAIGFATTLPDIDKEHTRQETVKSDAYIASPSYSVDVGAAISALVDAIAISGDHLDDSEITNKIKSWFLRDTFLKPAPIDVMTRNGVVTLSGTVASEQIAGRAIGLANCLEQVKSVNNQMIIKANLVAIQE
jgi:osmotically-inducible protein OsmY